MTWYTYTARITKAGHVQHDIVELDSPHGLPDGVPVYETKNAAREGYARGKSTKTPRTERCWAFVTVLDQTIGYLDAAGGATIDHKDAVLIYGKEEATVKLIELNLLEPGLWWVEQVVDELEFRRREDTW